MKRFLLLLFIPILAYSQNGEWELVNPKDFIPDIVIDMKYNDADHKFYDIPERGDIPLPKMYTTNECLALRKAVEQLKIAQDTLRKIRVHNGKDYPKGIGIKIWDAYRPRAVQFLFWEIFPNPIYVADPTSGSMHNRGGAIDLTLIDLATGEELAMPTEFDNFSNKASHGYTNLSAEVIANRALLFSIMTNVAGFQSYSAEWWHYNISGAGGYPLLDFQMK